MAYNNFTWWLVGKRRLNRYLKRGPLSELREYVDKYYNYSANSYIYESVDKILNKDLIAINDIKQFLNKDGTFNGSKALLVSPRMQDFFTSHGINWQNSFTPDELAKAAAFREFFSEISKNDRALLGCVVSDLITDEKMSITDVFTEDNKINPEFLNKLLRESLGHMTGWRSYTTFLKNSIFSKKFTTKYFGPDMTKLFSELVDGQYRKRSNFDKYSHMVSDMIEAGYITKDNVSEVLSFTGHYVELKDKLFDLIDPFDSSIRYSFIDSDGNIDPRLASRLSDVEIALMKQSYDPYYFIKGADYLQFISKEKRVNFGQVFRLGKNGELLLNEEYLKNHLDQFDLMRLFEYVDNHEYDLDQVDYEKLGISRSMFEALINVSKGSYEQGNMILEKLLMDKNLLLLEGEEAEYFLKISEALLNHMNNSNSKELNRFFGEILVQILNNPDNYEEKISRIENAFIHNDLPEMAKRFLVYKIMYPEFSFKQLDDMTMSPTLTHSNDRERDMIILGDLIRIAAESNNLSLRNYMNNIERGNALYIMLTTGEININELNRENAKTLTDFLKHLESVYNQTPAGKEHSVKLTGDMMSDLQMIHSLYGTTSRYDLPDRIVRMFGFTAGIRSFRELKEIMDNSVRVADERNRRAARERLLLREGDFLKGIGDQKYLYDILQNGSVAKEFLGATTPGSDMTPLDTDLTRIGKGFNVKKLVDDSYSSSYGPIWFVVKNDGRFKITRETAGEDTTTRCYGKEAFVTLGEWGIRTGFGSCDIDYILIDTEITKEDKEDLDEFDLKRKQRITADTKFAIVLNGFYIPVYDKNTGALIFTPKEYDLMRSKMAGLSRYGTEQYTFSEHLDDVPDYDNAALIEDSNTKRSGINAFVAQVMAQRGLRFSSTQSEDLELGGVDLIDTGSTGRGTNTEKTSDFDFIMRIDTREDKYALSKAICEALGLDYEKEQEAGHILGNGNLRLKGVTIPGVEEPVDLDISYVKKDEIDFYSTDECLKDRLESIRRQDPDKYQRVLDNIIYAKKFLKENGCYKPSHAPNSEGGLGGVGVENWILQNGGSFTDACRSFCAAATRPDGRTASFEEFKQRYQVFDFGRNFYGKGYDEFVSDNMTEEGYHTMLEACRKYVRGVSTRQRERSTSLTDSYEQVRTTNK